MQTLTERQQLLFEWLRAQHSATIEEIRSRFAISAPTAYRDVRALVEAGLAVKTSRRLKLAPPAEQTRSDGKCAFCGGSINERCAFVIQLLDGSQRNGCCPHCGLMALGQQDILAALATDFLYGRMVNIRQAVFVLGSSVDLCCQPSVLCFAKREDAQRFQTGFGGQIYALDQAVAQLKGLMGMPAANNPD